MPCLDRLLVRGLAMDAVVTFRQRASLPAFRTCLHECGQAVAGIMLDELPPQPAPPMKFISIVPGTGGVLGRVRAERRIRLTLPPATRWQVHQNAFLDTSCL